MLCRAACIAILLTSAAMAETNPPPRDDHLIRDPYITATGSTVDKPGQPQGSAPTVLDKRIQHQNNRIDDSICKGCR